MWKFFPKLYINQTRKRFRIILIINELSPFFVFSLSLNFMIVEFLCFFDLVLGKLFLFCLSNKQNKQENDIGKSKIWYRNKFTFSMEKKLTSLIWIRLVYILLYCDNVWIAGCCESWMPMILSQFHLNPYKWCNSTGNGAQLYIIHTLQRNIEKNI